VFEGTKTTKGFLMSLYGIFQKISLTVLDLASVSRIVKSLENFTRTFVVLCRFMKITS